MLADAIFAFLGVTTTVKFVANHSEEEDRKSFRWYEVCGIPHSSSRPALIFAAWCSYG